MVLSLTKFTDSNWYFFAIAGFVGIVYSSYSQNALVRYLHTEKNVNNSMNIFSEMKYKNSLNYKMFGNENRCKFGGVCNN